MNTYGIIIAVFASTGLWQLLQTRYIIRKKKRTPLESGVLALLHDRIYDISQDAILKGEITFAASENLDELYGPYKEMGGNGSAQRVMAEIDSKLKIIAHPPTSITEEDIDEDQ